MDGYGEFFNKVKRDETGCVLSNKFKFSTYRSLLNKLNWSYYLIYPCDGVILSATAKIDYSRFKRYIYPKNINEYYLQNYSLNFYESCLTIQNEKNSVKQYHELKVKYIDKNKYFYWYYDIKENDLQIHVEKDPELLDRVRKRNKRNKPPLAKTVLHIFIDALSLDQVKIFLPKTFNYLETFYGDTTGDAQSFQFLKYLSAKNTNHTMSKFYNHLPTLSQMTSPENSNEDGSIFRYYHENGYVVGSSFNSCESNWYKGGGYKYFDLDITPIFCDLNYCFQNFISGPFGSGYHCVKYRKSADISIEYVTKFMEAYKDEQKYFRLYANEAHTTYINNISVYDDKFVKLFESMDLSESIIILHADHGNHQNFGIGLRVDHDYREMIMPAWVMRLPRRVADKYQEALVHNEQALVSSYDVYNTVAGLSGETDETFNDLGYDESGNPHSYNLLIQKVPIGVGYNGCNEFRIPHCVCDNNY